MTNVERSAQSADGNSSREDDEGSRADAISSQPPGGGGQKEQEPARARRTVQTSQARPDPEIRKELAALLAGRDDLDPAAVELLVAEGVVMMLGEVPDYPTKRKLEEACAALPGVREIHDQLQVSGDGLTRSSDGLRTEAPRAGFRGAGS